MEHLKNMQKIFNSFQYKHDIFSVFEDFLYMSASAFSNAIDKVHYEEREKEYLRRINKYSKEDQALFPKLLSELVMCFERGGPNDYLGRLFMDLDLGNKFKGQFFTPYPVSKLMTSMILSKESIEKAVKEKGYITLSEPTCGSGGMIIAAYEVISNLKLNPQQVLRVTSQDIDFKAVLMTYIQTTLLGIDNTVILGDTLMMEKRDVWRTPGRFLRIYGLLESIGKSKDISSEVLDEYDREEGGQLVLSF